MIDITSLHKITCLGEQVNPLLYNRETGEFYRVIYYNSKGDRLKTPIIRQPTSLSKGYLSVRVNNKKLYQIHQIIAMEFLGHIPDGYTTIIDHINGNRLDNRLENLQVVTARQNVRKGRLNTARKDGLPANVYSCGSGYRVRFWGNTSKAYNFGRFNTLTEAAAMALDIQTRLDSGCDLLKVHQLLAAD